MDLPKKIIIATHNKGKISQFKKLFSELEQYVELVSLYDLNMLDDIEETGETFEKNSLLKAKTIYDQTGTPTIGEDSGLCIDAFNGAPGVYTARFRNHLSKIERLQSILDDLKDTPDDKRGAQFVSVITGYFGENNIIQVNGTVEGSIIREIIAPEHGMAYTPIFKAKGQEKTFSQLTEDELIAQNHRGLASKKFVEEFKKFFNLK